MVTSFIVDIPMSAADELAYYLRLAEPVGIFCDAALRGAVAAAADDAGSSAPVVALDDYELSHFVKEFCGDLDAYTTPVMEPDDVILILPTSGSTGMPKAAMLTNRGLLAQIPILWTHQSQFPSPTRLALVLATPQWVTFTMMVSAAIACRVSLLMSPRVITYDHVIHMMETYQ
ncbi:hypothetical protein ACJJTC_010698, partial [Scirpophaga incertulas]